MKFPWRLYLAATLVGAFAGLIGGTFHALLDQAATSRGDLKALLDAAPMPGWLLLMLLGALVLVTAMWLVRRFAPETAGSGVQEVEAILAGERKLRWHRVLPIKFVAGTLAVGSGLVLGREGPTIHMGAALGQLASERLEPNPAANRALIAAGAAAGLATAFNAPLASIVFVTEELREHFEYRFATIQSVILACCAAVIVSGWMLGQGPDMAMPDLDMAPLEALPLFLLLGIFIGALGVLFNSLLLGSVASFRALGSPGAYAAAAVTGLILGALLWFAPNTVGGGETLVERLLHGQPALFFLMALFAVRLLTTIGSYGLGLPGGIFAPMLALGTVCGALFAATVRAPLTGIILVIELTGAQALALPIILTCLAATFTAEGLGGSPIYSSLLGLQKLPPPRTPVRRIAAAAMILVAFIAIERIDVAFQGTGMGPIKTLAETEPPLQAVTDKTPAVDSTSADEREVALSSPTAPTLAQPAPAEADAATKAAGTKTADRAPDESESAPPSRPLASEDAPASTASGDALLAPAADSDQTAQELQPGGEQADSEPVAIIEEASERGPAIGSKAAFSIQLISFRNAASLAQFAADEGLLGRALKLAAADQGGRWHAVLLGTYADRAAAETALAELPERLQRLEPIIRPLAPDERLVPIESP